MGVHLGVSAFFHTLRYYAPKRTHKDVRVATGGKPRGNLMLEERETGKTRDTKRYCTEEIFSATDGKPRGTLMLEEKKKGEVVTGDAGSSPVAVGSSRVATGEDEPHVAQLAEHQHDLT